ncbi:hypothetical protein [Saccharothrix sp. ALI-22-I]|uniref:hypothetical protein n=1 Tax=Saccharothrix sp. ALI-22-I TaxID=1933778 RepID=UPI0015C35AC6|nr:hypothetical protein [Saccharothrix sp. ALI-22-I]
MTKDELLFNTWLTSVNSRLGRYIVRLMDESVHVAPTMIPGPNGEPKYTVDLAEVEAELAADLNELAQAIAMKAAGQPYLLQVGEDSVGSPVRPLRLSRQVVEALSAVPVEVGTHDSDAS